jgi:hypothetical protein
MNIGRLLPLIGLLGVAALITTACDEISIRTDSDQVSGSGTVISETREVSGFDRIVLAGEGRVIVTRASDESLVIETDDNLLRHIESDVQGNKLTLTTESGVDIDPSDTVVYRIGAERLNGIDLLGAGTFELEEWDVDRFDILLAGAGDIRIGHLTTDHLDVTLGGAGSIEVAGHANRQTVNLPGVGNFAAGSLHSDEATVRATGAATATLWVSDALDVAATGVGSIKYYGEPDIDRQVAGLASIESLGTR